MRVVVVGAGISGILAAAVARSDGHEVTVIDAARAPGGLLRSIEASGGVFDLGTHIPRETGTPEVDSLLFAPMEKGSWRRLERIRAGGVVAGELSSRTEFPSVLSLGRDIAERALDEMRELDRPQTSFSNLDEQLRLTFGNTITDLLFGPALAKFTGEQLLDLVPDAHRLFASRVVVGSAEEIAALKQSDSWWDTRAAYHDSSVGASELAAWYPSNGGVGRWIEALRHDVLGEARWVLGDAVDSVEFSAKRLGVRSGRQFKWDVLVWSVGIFPFLKACGATPSRALAPVLRRTDLLHLQSTMSPESDLHYITFFDPDIPPFRVTLYSNLRGTSSKSAVHDLTVEFLSAPEHEQPDWRRTVVLLKDLGILKRRALVSLAAEQRIDQGFPVPTHSMAGMASNLLAACSEYQSVAFVGRGAGRAFFTHDVLSEVPKLVRTAVSHSG